MMSKDQQSKTDFAEKLLSENVKSLQERIKESQAQLTSYSALAKDLLKLSEKSSARVMVPLCEVAFIPSKLKHTNEIHVHVGDGHFVQRTAQECQPMIERRTTHIEDNLKLMQDQLSKQFGIRDIFTEQVGSKKSTPPNSAATTPAAPDDGGIPETRVNEEGHLEIFEAYVEPAAAAQGSVKPKPLPVAKPQPKKAGTSLQYVDFDFSKPKKTFANARSPADLRSAMDAQYEEQKILNHQEQLEPTTHQVQAQQKVESIPRQMSLSESMMTDQQQPMSSQIVERSEGQLIQHRSIDNDDPPSNKKHNEDSEEEEVKPKKRISKFAQAKLDALAAKNKQQ